MIDIVGWITVMALFVVGMIGIVYPILPSVLAVFGAFFVYGWFFSFAPFGFWFWSIQSLLVIVIVLADYAVSAYGIKKFGGSRASIIGNVVGILVGPFIIPFLGLLIGPFLGAVIAEVIQGTPYKQALRIGIGSVIGFFSSALVKIVLQSVMIILFYIWIVLL